MLEQRSRSSEPRRRGSHDTGPLATHGAPCVATGAPRPRCQRSRPLPSGTHVFSLMSRQRHRRCSHLLVRDHRPEITCDTEGLSWRTVQKRNRCNPPRYVQRVSSSRRQVEDRPNRTTTKGPFKCRASHCPVEVESASKLLPNPWI